MSRAKLALLVVSADAARLRAALVLARAEVALDGGARIFLQGEAAALLKPPLSDPADHVWRGAGEPSLAELLDAALNDGVAVSLCQSGLAMAGMDGSAIDARIEISGPIAFLAGIGEETRLAIV